MGATKTLNSRHLTGHAVDIVPYYDADGDGELDLWDWRLYDRLGPIGESVAKSMKLPLVWGGRWRTFKDGPHWELCRSEYPDDEDWKNTVYRISGSLYLP